MITTKQHKTNRIEYWLRLGPLGNGDDRKTYPSRTYVRRCICGLTYTKNNWVLKARVIAGLIILGSFTLAGLLIPIWPLIELLAVTWTITTIIFLALGHKPLCALRRPTVGLAESMGLPG